MGLKPNLQRLMYGGKQLENEHNLAFYGVKKEATLHLLLGIRGGMVHDALFSDYTQGTELVGGLEGYLTGGRHDPLDIQTL